VVTLYQCCPGNHGIGIELVRKGRRPWEGTGIGQEEGTRIGEEGENNKRDYRERQADSVAWRLEGRRKMGGVSRLKMMPERGALYSTRCLLPRWSMRY
jgi:hypothetical protein